MTSSADRQRSPGGPAIDAGAHLRNLVVALPIALLVAVIAFATTLAVRSLASPVYEAEATATIAVNSQLLAQSNPASLMIALAQPYIVLSNDPRSQDLLAEELGSPVDDAIELTVTPGAAPNLLSITARADDAEVASQAAVTSIEVLNLRRDEMQSESVTRNLEGFRQSNESLRAIIDSLPPEDPLRARIAPATETVIAADDLLGGAPPALSLLSVGDSTKASPRPVREATLVGLVVLLLSAELIVLARRRLGTKANRIWTRSEASSSGASYRETRDLPAGVADALRRQALAALAVASPEHAGSSDVTVIALADDRYHDEIEASARHASIVVHRASRIAGLASLFRESTPRALLLVADDRADRQDLAAALDLARKVDLPADVVFVR